MNNLENIDVKSFLAAMNDKKAKKLPQEVDDGNKDLDSIISEIEESYGEKAPFSKEEKERLKQLQTEKVEDKPEIDLDTLEDIIKQMVASGEIDPGSVGMKKELAEEREKNLAKKNSDEEIEMLEGMIDERELAQPTQGLMGKAMMKMKEKVDRLKSTKK